MMSAEIKTGTDLWCLITAESLEFLETAILENIIISKKLWPSENIKVISEHIPREKIEKIKKQAFRRIVTTK